MFLRKRQTIIAVNLAWAIVMIAWGFLGLWERTGSEDTLNLVVNSLGLIFGGLWFGASIVSFWPNQRIRAEEHRDHGDLHV